ncbi:MAG: outer membrane protein assembly factor BamB [Acidiferrobacterales bacterium]|nr:outer membrane protein assembly factor BamB [Acidiferrobacterales bacterium]
MKNIRLLLLMIAAFILVACGSSSKDTDYFQVEEPAKKPSVSNQSKLERNWRVNLGDKIAEGDAILSPVLSGAHIYAAATNGRIEKIEAETGRRVWRAELEDQVISAGVDVGSGLVLAGTDQGLVYALSTEDGSVDWQVQLSTEILASPVIGDDVVVARSSDGKVYGIDPYNGEITWTISRQLPPLTLRGESKPLVVQGVIIAGFPDGTLAAIEASNGRALWDFPISFPRGNNELDRLADIDTTPLLVGNYVYVTSYQEITHALNIAEQRIAWSAEVSSTHPFAYDSAHLYISDSKGVVHQLNRTSGQVMWTQGGLRLRNISAPISVGPYLVVGDGDGKIFVMSKVDGSYVGSHTLGAQEIVGKPIVDSNVIYFMDSDGAVQSVSISDIAD